MTGYVYRGTTLNDPARTTCQGVTGTIKGYGRHVRASERPCGRCREAMNAYNRERRQRWETKPGAVEKDRARRRARARAWAALAKRHPGEYQALLRQELGQIHAQEDES